MIHRGVVRFFLFFALILSMINISWAGEKEYEHVEVSIGQLLKEGPRALALGWIADFAPHLSLVNQHRILQQIEATGHVAFAYPSSKLANAYHVVSLSRPGILDPFWVELGE